MTIIKIRIAQMNPTVDWMWYTAICHNNVNAGFGACYLIAQFQNHQKEHFKGRFEAHIPKDESLVVALKLTVLFFFFWQRVHVLLRCALKKITPQLGSLLSLHAMFNERGSKKNDTEQTNYSVRDKWLKQLILLSITNPSVRNMKMSTCLTVIWLSYL